MIKLYLNSIIEKIYFLHCNTINAIYHRCFFKVYNIITMVLSQNLKFTKKKKN